MKRDVLVKVFLAMALVAGFATLSRAGDVPSFRLGPGDILEISVWKDTELTKQVVIEPDGYLSFALIGQIEAGGRTLGEVRQDIVARLREYIPDPTVTVIPLKIVSYKVYVVGKVNKPGMFQLPNSVNVMQALSLAGGTNPFANLKRISILRQGPEGPSNIPFDYEEVVRGKELQQNIMLHSGDVVVVP